MQDHFRSYDAETTDVEFQDIIYWGVGILDATPEPDPEAELIEVQGLGQKLTGQSVCKVTYAIGISNFAVLPSIPSVLNGWRSLLGHFSFVIDEHAGKILWQHDDGRYVVWQVNSVWEWLVNKSLSTSELPVMIANQEHYSVDINDGALVGHNVTDIDAVGVGL